MGRHRLLRFAVEIMIVISLLAHLSQVEPCGREPADGQLHAAFIRGFLELRMVSVPWQYTVEEGVDLRNSRSSYKTNS